MYTAWTKHLHNPEEKKKFEQGVLSSKPVLDHLKGLLAEMETDLDRAETNPKNYEVPNWDYRQAHNNGYRQCLYILQKLVDLDSQVLKENK